MKKRILVAGLMMVSFGLALQAQINVRSDGGVRIGVPSSSIPGLRPTWKLTSKGLETYIGNVLFHTSKGHLLVSDVQDEIVSVGSNGLGVTSVVNTTALTGSNLCVGSSSSYAFRAYVDEVISTSSQKVISDRRYKENIKDLEDASSKVMQLRPVSFDLKVREGYVGDTMGLKGKVGFIAQEVQEIFPNLVGYLPESDQYVLDYTSFIPYLTQTIQLQAQQLEEQGDRISELETLVQFLLESRDDENPVRAPRNPSSKEDDGQRQLEGQLYQNVPNPFSEVTTIKYVLPGNIQSAKIILHASSGKMVDSYELPLQAGFGQLSIEGGRLSPGMYTYSLVIDNQNVVTKRMVVTD